MLRVILILSSVIFLRSNLLAGELTPTALTELIVADMTQAHEARPQGVPDSHSWALKPRIGKGDQMPHNWSAVTILE